MGGREIKQCQSITWEQGNVILKIDNIKCSLNVGGGAQWNWRNLWWRKWGIKAKSEIAVYTGHEPEFQRPYCEGQDPNSVWIFNNENQWKWNNENENEKVNTLYYNETVMMKGTDDHEEPSMCVV